MTYQDKRTVYRERVLAWLHEAAKTASDFDRDLDAISASDDGVAVIVDCHDGSEVRFLVTVED